MTVTVITPEHRPELAALAVETFKDIDWRHNGIGVLQGYVVDKGETESRFHIWHPSLMLPGMAEGGLYHDHRFDLLSHVLIGEIHHDELEVVPDPNGPYEFARVTNARKAKAQGGHADGEFHSEPERLGERFRLEHHPMVIGANNTYLFPKLAFHGSSTKGLAVTYVEKRNQEDIKARLIVPFGEEYTHAFAHTRPRGEWEHLIDEAVEALRHG